MDKPRKPREVRLAGSLLMLCLGVSACLLPQDEPQLIPPFRNQAPRIRPEKVSPPHSFQVERSTLGGNCLAPKVEVTVEDPDFRQPLYVKWVVFREDGTKDPRQLDFRIEPTGTLVRPTLSPPDTLFTDTALADLTVDGGVSRHRLDLFVADNYLSIDPKGVPSVSPFDELVFGPDGGLIENPPYIDSYSWIVTTVPGLCQ